MIWCPPHNFQINTNQCGYVDFQSSFNVCYNPSTKKIRSGVWTGVYPLHNTPPHLPMPSNLNGALLRSPLSARPTMVASDDLCQCRVISKFHPFIPQVTSVGNSGVCDTKARNDDHKLKTIVCDQGQIATCCIYGGVGTCGIDYTPGNWWFSDTPAPSPAPVATEKRQSKLLRANAIS